MFKHVPEAEFIFNKTVSNVEATIDFNAAVFAKSLEYFNSLTDRNFYSMTSQVAESINKVTDYAKENFKTTSGTIKSLLATSK